MDTSDKDTTTEALVARAASIGAAHALLRRTSMRDLSPDEAVALISAWPRWRCMFQPVDGEVDVGHWAVWHVGADGESEGELVTFVSISQTAIGQLPQEH